MKKNKIIISEQINLEQMIDEKSTLCIKNKIATNYRYNKDQPNYPFCISNLSCVYRNKIGDKFYCDYMKIGYEKKYGGNTPLHNL